MKRFVGLSVLGLVLLAACSGSSSSKSAARIEAPSVNQNAFNAESNGVSNAARTFNAESNGVSTPSNSSPPVDLTKVKQPDSRQLIKTGDITLQAKNVDAALRKATDIVHRAGGDMFSGDSELADANDRHIHAVFKVPPEQFDAVVAQLGSVGKVTSNKTNSEDITGQVVDLDARLAAARTSVARLRDLLVHSGNVTDLLQVEQTLSQREGEVESLDAESQALHAQVAQATITVDFVPAPVVATAAPSHHIPGFLKGLHTGAAAFANTALVLATGFGLALPFLVVIALIGLPTARVLRRRRGAVPAAN